MVVASAVERLVLELHGSDDGCDQQSTDDEEDDHRATPFV